jgi:imidazolonepropionase-like amidohydrolase
MTPSSRVPAAKRLLLHPSRIVDVRQGVYVSDVGVLIDAGRIVEVTPYDDLARREASTPVMELPGLTLLPGLIDCHTHLLTSFRPHVGEDHAVIFTIATMSTAERALLGARNAREVLEGGITTVRDVGNSGLAGDVALARAIEAGWVMGPRMVPTTRSLAPSGGQLPLGMNPAVAAELVAQEYAVVCGPEGVRRGVREAIAAGARAIKLIGDANGSALRVDELRAAVEEARPLGIKVAVHAVNEIEVHAAALAGVDSIEHAYGATDDDLELMRDNRVFLVPTDYPLDNMLITMPVAADAQAGEQLRAMLDRMIARRRERLHRAAELGVRIAFGSDWYYDHPEKTRAQASLDVLREYLAAGLTVPQILRAATVDAAELLGGRVGTLDAGAPADILGVRGDPLHDLDPLFHAALVVKGGAIIVHR